MNEKCYFCGKELPAKDEDRVEEDDFVREYYLADTAAEPTESAVECHKECTPQTYNVWGPFYYN